MNNNFFMKAEEKEEISLNSNNFTKEEFQRFLLGKYKKEDKTYKETENLRIEFNPKLQVFNLFYYKHYKEGGNFEIFGSFKDIIKIKRTIYKVKNKIIQEKEEIIKITNVKGKKKEDTVKEFSLSETKYIEIGQFVKFGNQKEQILFSAYTDFFYFIKSDFIPYREEKLTSCYGIFSKKKILLPGKYDLLESTNKNQELINFEKQMTTEEQKQKEELRKIGLKLKKYLNLSYTSQILFSYSLISPFRYYLMNGKGLKEFSFLGLQGEGGTGKTTRIKILYNLFHSGLNFNGYGQHELNSPFRFNILQNVLIPLVLDDPSYLKPTQIEEFKHFATSSLRENNRGTSNQQIKEYKNIRPFIMSFNSFKIFDSNLISRFIFIDLSSENLQNKEEQPKEDLIEYLENNINFLGKFFYDNIKDFFSVLENFSFDTERTKAKETILNLGFTLISKFFELLEIKPLSRFRFIQYTTKGEDFIINEKDKIKNQLKTQLSKITQVNIRDDIEGTYNTYNIYDLLNNEIENSIREKIINTSSIKGIYLHNNNFLLTKQTLNYISLDNIKLSSITILKEAFNKNEYKIIGKGQETQTIKINKYGVKTGFLILNNNEETKEETKEQEQEININTLQTENEELKSKIIMLEKQIEEMKKQKIEVINIK